MQYIFTSEDLENGAASAGQPYFEFLKRPTLSAGIYTLKAGQPDLQKPHTEDEIYLVLAGSSQMLISNASYNVHAGDLIYVPAFVEHRFYDITEDLRLLVFFSSAPIDQSV